MRDDYQANQGSADAPEASISARIAFTSTTFTCPTVTTTQDECLLYRIAAVTDADQPLSTSPGTARWEEGKTTGTSGPQRQAGATQEQAVAGATGTAAFTGTQTRRSVTATVALAPAAAAGGFVPFHRPSMSGGMN